VDVEIVEEHGPLIRIRHFDENGDFAVECAVESTWLPGDGLWQGVIDDSKLTFQVRPILNGMRLSHGGLEQAARVYTTREAELAALMLMKQPPDTSKFLLCPMPGLIVTIHVSEGQQVKAGDSLCVVEAMKMENILRAERDCTVTQILVEPGDSLAVDATIMMFE